MYFIRICIIILIFFMAKAGQAQERDTLKLAMAQMLVEGGEKEANLKRAADKIKEAATNSADIVLLPEAMDLGWTHSSAKTLAEPIPGGTTFQVLSKAAKENKVYVCAGIIEKDGGRIFNSAVLIDREGKLLLKHRKINELDIAHDVYGQGDRINVCETEFGTIGLLICADATAKDNILTRSLGYLGADLILLPSAWAVEPTHDNSENPYGGLWLNAFNPVCKEFNLNIAAVSNVGEITDGPWEGWYCIGNSIFIGNNGDPVTVLPYGKSADTIVYQDVVLLERPGRGTTWYNYWSTLDKK